MRIDRIIHLLCLWAAFFLEAGAQQKQMLKLPRQEQLSSQHITHVIADSEGFLWYATEGGGVCRDDGRHILVFRNDAETQDLLCSNDVACLVEAGNRYILIGTYHGACFLDKQDYAVMRLTEVDDKRVDDIVIDKDGHWWLTANKKIYEYADRKLLNTYLLGDKYIFRLREDPVGGIWALEWEGGWLQLRDGRFEPVPTEKVDSISFVRQTTDLQGRLLVSDGLGKCYALGGTDQKPWFEGQILTKSQANAIRDSLRLSARPTAVASDVQNNLWFSTGKDIRLYANSREEVMMPDTKDVSAMTFTQDGTLWLATIFGTLMTYKNGFLSTDSYASNEYGDAVLALQTDSLGRLVLVSDRYVRLYDPNKQTLRQRNIEVDGIYCVELQETRPHERWSRPEPDTVNSSWIKPLGWMLLILMIVLCLLIGYIGFLHRQCKRFLKASEQPAFQSAQLHDEWLQEAIGMVNRNISDETYGVEQLSRDLCISRMTLYRKIQSSTGQKPTEFIRTIRLRRAAELLRKGQLTVAEISYETGFSSVSYFSRCFRSMYGVPPTQY